MTTTELDQIHAKATVLQERVRQTITSVQEISSSPLAPPVKSPAYQNLNKAEQQFTDLLHNIKCVLAMHGLATWLRREGGEGKGEVCKELVAKMNDALVHIEQQIGLAEGQLVVAAIAIAKRVVLPGSVNSQ